MHIAESLFEQIDLGPKYILFYYSYYLFPYEIRVFISFRNMCVICRNIDTYTAVVLGIVTVLKRFLSGNTT
jgi:hypothetical protein